MLWFFFYYFYSLEVLKDLKLKLILSYLRTFLVKSTLSMPPYVRFLILKKNETRAKQKIKEFNQGQDTSFVYHFLQAVVKIGSVLEFNSKNHQILDQNKSKFVFDLQSSQFYFHYEKIFLLWLGKNFKFVVLILFSDR